MIASAAFPLGLLIVAPLAEFVFEPAMRAQGAWVAVFGPVIGAGAGRGIALVFILTGLFNIVAVSVFAWRLPISELDAKSR